VIGSSVNCTSEEFSLFKKMVIPVISELLLLGDKLIRHLKLKLPILLKKSETQRPGNYISLSLKFQAVCNRQM
jgi:hypothetical protein